MIWEPIRPAAPVTRTNIFGDIDCVSGSISRELDLHHFATLPFKRHDSPKDSRVMGARTRRFPMPAPEGPKADVKTIIRLPPCQIAEPAWIYSTRSDDAQNLSTYLLLTM